MEKKSWFLAQPHWMRGGLIGLLVCIMLFAIYLGIASIAPAFMGGMLPGWIVFPAFATGHGFVAMSGYMIDVRPFCPQVGTSCVAWSIVSGCTATIPARSSLCEDTVRTFTYILSLLSLLTAYALIGGFIGWIIGRYKKSR